MPIRSKAESSIPAPHTQIWTAKRFLKSALTAKHTSVFHGKPLLSEIKELNRRKRGIFFGKKKSDVSVEEKAEFDDEDFCNALKIYRELPIEKSISHTNPLVRMFAVTDRKVGKRTLEKLSETAGNQPDWLREFYLLRINAETL